MIGILLRVSLVSTFLSYAGLIVLNAVRDIPITDLNDTIAIYVAINLQLLLNIIYYTACFMVWFLIGCQIIRYPQTLGKIKEILLFIKYLILSKSWSTKILIFYVIVLIVVFWVPALFPFLHIGRG